MMTNPGNKLGSLYNAMQMSIQKNSNESTWASGRNTRKSALASTQYVSSKPLNVYNSTAVPKLSPECKGIGKNLPRFQSQGKAYPLQKNSYR